MNVLQSSRRPSSGDSPFTSVRGTTAPGIALVLAASIAACSGSGAGRGSAQQGATFSGPTHSSPITMSRDGRLVWAVNPADDSVSVIRTDRNEAIARIAVGDEPQGVALDPDDRYAYVANAAAGTVTVIRIDDPNPDSWRAGVDESVGDHGALATGAEPWNIVSSPDGRRVFVANSGQDTVTVIDASRRAVIGSVDLRNSLCNDPDRARHFQPRGLAVTEDGKRLFVTRFFSFVRPGGQQGTDDGREGLVCRLDIDTASADIRAYRPAAAIPLAPRITGFKIDSSGDGVPDDTTAFPNQLQSVVIRGDQAYLPNIAASPSGPLRFDVDTQAFVSVIDGVSGTAQVDASASKALNLHAGARDPEPGKKRLFFANPWAIAFTSRSGLGSAYVVSAGSDLLVKVTVAADGKLGFTGDADTTRYIDLNDPNDPATSGANAGKNPQGIAIDEDGTRAYVANFLSRNVSVVDLATDRVIETIQTTDLPPPGSVQETVLVGAEMFFSSRGHFDRPPGTTVSTSERLSNAGWQSCSSCHFKGLGDSVVWAFASGPRKSIPLNGSFNPHSPDTDQRVLNYSAVNDEIEDFELNIRNVSGPGGRATPGPCDGGAGTSTFDPDHGLLASDAGDLDTPPCTINALPAKANADRNQFTVTLPGSGRSPVPSMTALREWVKRAVRTPRGPHEVADVTAGRALFAAAGCASCHGGQQWTNSIKDFVSPPAAAAIATEPPPAAQAPYLSGFLVDVGSFNLGVPGQGNPIGDDIGAAEKAAPGVVGGVSQAAPDALGFDFDGDGKGSGFTIPSLLGIHASPPFLHNGACETLACVLSDVNHRTAKGALPDVLVDPLYRAQLAEFLESIDAATATVP